MRKCSGNKTRERAHPWFPGRKVPLSPVHFSLITVNEKGADLRMEEDEYYASSLSLSLSLSPLKGLLLFRAATFYYGAMRTYCYAPCLCK